MTDDYKVIFEEWRAADLREGGLHDTIRAFVHPRISVLSDNIELTGISRRNHSVIWLKFQVFGILTILHMMNEGQSIDMADNSTESKLVYHLLTREEPVKPVDPAEPNDKEHVINC